MKYVIVDNDNGVMHIDCITEQPVNYAAKFEPIDVVDGKLLAWDETGNLYEFSSREMLDNRHTSKSLSVVEVGKWDFKNGEPLFKEVANNRANELRDLLVDYIERKHAPKRSWFGKKRDHAASVDKVDYSKTSVDELVDIVGRLLK